MRFSPLKSCVALLSTANALNILISNDDGFGTANIRELYKAMVRLGHNVYIVASATNQSGMGGTSVYTTQRNLTADSEFGIVKKGAPSIGTDPNDSHIWYFNGTPSTCVQVALDYILPRYTNLSTFDLMLSGPNYGLNLGPFLYTLAGTLGATYTAVERGIPAIAFSGGYSVQTPYYNVTNPVPATGLSDPATVYAQLAANLVQTVISNVAKAGGGRVLPRGYGLNVNMAEITTLKDSSCTNPPFVQTRLTGKAVVDKAVYNETTGLFTYGNDVNPGVNQCINGDCSLPGEQSILDGSGDVGTQLACASSVSVFTVDYDAPTTSACHSHPDIRSLLLPLVQYSNNGSLSGLMGGLGNGTGFIGNATTTVSSHGSVVSSSPSAIAVSGGGRLAFGTRVVMGLAGVFAVLW